jgi:ATP-dependent Clp protease ATP-binding subunit ClpA
MRLPEDPRIPFSPRAKQALERSLREVDRLGGNRITAEHLLLGILRENRGTAVRIINDLGVQPREVEDRLEQLRSGAATR